MELVRDQSRARPFAAATPRSVYAELLKVSQEFARQVADEGVTVAEWATLRSLYKCDPMPPSVLARNMGMTKGAISKLADRLMEKGLIAREGNLEDKRGHTLSLTAEGAAKVPILARLADGNDAAFFSGLSGEQHSTLRALLRTLIDRHTLKSTPID